MRKPSIYDERYTDSPPGRNRLDTVERGRAKKLSNDDYDDDEESNGKQHGKQLSAVKKKEQNSLYTQYTDLMILYPLSMNVSQAFIITTFSVLISQRISGMEQTDWFEVLVAALVSSLWITPILLGTTNAYLLHRHLSLTIHLSLTTHYLIHIYTYTSIYLLAWFRAMAKMPTGTIGKILIDQICFSPIFTATIVSWRTLLLGKVSYQA